MSDEGPLILTAWLDESTFQWADRLRKTHFPSERNFIPAHLTLFHHLPGPERKAVCELLTAACADQSSISAQFPALRFLGFGSAITVQAPELQSLRRQLAGNFQSWLTRQDQQKWQPHITIQNKVRADEAKALFAQLQSDWTPRSGRVEGLMLWRYLGGPWEPLQQFQFSL